MEKGTEVQKEREFREKKSREKKEQGKERQGKRDNTIAK